MPQGPTTPCEKAGLILLAVVMSSITSFVVARINIEIGIFATGSLGEQLQVSIASEIAGYMQGKMDPLRIFLQQGIKNADERGLNLSSWHDLELMIPYMRSFLDTYFDESRCCTCMFVNMNYDNNRDGIDDSLSCHAIMRPKCSGTATGSMAGEIDAQDLMGNSVWAGVLHYSDSYTSGSYPGLDDLEFTADARSGDMLQILPGRLDGAPNNTLTFREYGFKRSIGEWHGDADLSADGTKDQYGNAVQRVGFVHWPIVDGFWYRGIKEFNMTKGEVRFAERVFPWTLYPPAVLKTHLFTPVYDPNGVQIGGWVVGFKLHWISNYLRDIVQSMDGMFAFVVERHTGVLVSSSDPTIKVLKAYSTAATVEDTILAAECVDMRVSGIAHAVMELIGATSDNWSKVGDLIARKDISTNKVSTEDFLVTRVFEIWGISWVIVLSIPRKTITADIDRGATGRVFIVVGVSGAFAIVAQFMRTVAVNMMRKYNPYHPPEKEDYN